jgi:hypothetical protein
VFRIRISLIRIQPKISIRIRIPDPLEKVRGNCGRGLYIAKYPPWGGGEISRCHLGEKYEKGEEEKGEHVKEKGRKGKEKGRKGKENEKRGSKR